MLWEFGGAPLSAGNLFLFPTDTLIAFYFLGQNPTADQIKDFAQNYDIWTDWSMTSDKAGISTQQITFSGVTYDIPTALPPPWSKMWSELDSLLTNTVIPKRAAVGPLPPNAFLSDPNTLSDPIVLYYYDDVWLKRVSYPLVLAPVAATQDQWWNLAVGQIYVRIEVFASGSTDLLGNRGPTSSTDPNGVWVDEGWDMAKNSGAFFDIVHTIVSVLAMLLSATGIGTVLAAFIVAVLNIAVDLLQAAEDAINGGNPGAALVNIGQAILSVGAAEMGQLQTASPALAKLGKLGISQLGALLMQVGVDTTPSHQTMNFADTLKTLEAKAPQYQSKMTLDAFNALLSVVSGGGGVAIPLAQNGWDTAQYASRQDIIAVGKIYEQAFPGPAAALWKMGAQLGTLGKTQQSGKALPPGAVQSATMAPHSTITPIAALTSPAAQLMAYVRSTLKPRYHL